MVTWWIGGILLTTFYTAHLTASLARPIKAKLIEQPEELLLPANEDVNWVALEGGPFHGQIKVTFFSSSANYRYSPLIPTHVKLH